MRLIETAPLSITLLTTAAVLNLQAKNVVEALPRLQLMGDLFEQELMKRSERAKQSQKPYEPPPRKQKAHFCRHKREKTI